MPRKRGNGEGSISYEKDRKKYRARITDNEGNVLSKRFDTKQEASIWLAEVTTDISRKTYIAPRNITLMEWIDEYLLTYKQGSVKPTTLATYYHNAVPLKLIGGVQLQELTTHDVQRFYRDAVKKYTEGQVAKAGKLLRGALYKAVEVGVVPKNVALSAVAPKHITEHFSVFTDAQLKLMEDTLNNEKHRLVYVAYKLALNTGMRIGEVLGLKTDCIKPDKIIVKTSLQMVDGRPLDVAPKTLRSKRSISISPKIYQLLMDYLAERRGFENVDYFFITRKGTPITKPNFQSRWGRALLAAGVEGVTFHSLRHTHATKLIAAGVPIADVSARLGHANVSTTLDIYVHPSENSAEEIARKLDTLF